MANQEQLDILKKGVDVWNRWRMRLHPDIRPDLSQADLSGAQLSRADLRGANLNGANLSRADLSLADLSGANLSRANLSRADLSGADLSGTTLNEAILSKAIFYGASVGYTVFGDVDLRTVNGLETVRHRGPSTIGIDTILRSKGYIPEVFLQGTGVTNTFIDHVQSLAQNPSDYYTCFISYSSKDQDFAEHLYADLQNKGVRCWFAPEDLKIGDKIRPRIEESIRLYDKLLLVLSEHSIASTWVAYEVERALNKEPTGIPNVLFPIRLDRAVMDSIAGWANDIKSTRHIGDFSNWKNHGDYQKAFSRLLRDLKAESAKYKPIDDNKSD